MPRPKKTPGTKVLKEIQEYDDNESTKLIRSIRKLPFQRLVREVAESIKPGLQFQSVALIALQEASEMYMAQFFEDSLLIALHRKRTNVTAQDIRLVHKLLQRNYQQIEKK